MNEKVLTMLERQAEKNTLDLPCSLDADEYTQIFNEQLVKLAVQECIDILAGYRSKVTWYNEDEMHQHPIYVIQKYFGIDN